MSVVPVRRLCRPNDVDQPLMRTFCAVVAMHIAGRFAIRVGIVHTHGVIEYDDLSCANLTFQKTGQFVVVTRLPLLTIIKIRHLRRCMDKAEAVIGKTD